MDMNPQLMEGSSANAGTTNLIANISSSSSGATPTQPLSSSPPSANSSRYENQKRRDWNTFGQYLRNQFPPLSLSRCSEAHVLEFLRYLDQFGKTKVHTTVCHFYGHPNPPASCPCPLRQSWGSLDALIGRLRAAFEENGGQPETNPFGARAVRLYLREVRDMQTKARGVSYEKKKRKRPTLPPLSASSAVASHQQLQMLPGTSVNKSERASKGTSSKGLLHTVYIYCADELQYSFASHLSVEFHQKGIDASVNCNATLDVIKGASAFVVVLSKNYLSSPSCLDKLLRVLHCRRKHFQLLIPVFYGIRPSDVTVQESDDRVRDWNSALQDLRDLPGIHSREESSDCELVEEIVKDVFEKLFPMQQIGINSRLVEIKQLLCKQPWSIRRIGIWGMAGIGKTTLAKAFFDQVSGGYEASCFIKHFDKAFHEKGLYRLWDEHFGKLLKDSLPGGNISKKRTLVVLDDVQNPLIAESFLQGFHWFGPGSLIIITSRDKRVFRLCQISHVYEVKSLNKNEALRLFSYCAFGKDIEEENISELQKEMLDYANGNPLALSFYGGELKGKNLSEPNMIHDLLMSSYETLDDNEKEIFLDIACFFKGDDVDYVKQLLEGCGLFPHVGIDVLVEKCLVTISENRVEMHKIIQNFGREINNRETIGIRRNHRLWKPCCVKFLLEDEKIEANRHPNAICNGTLVTEDIKAISLDTANMLFDVKPSAFENMLT